MHISFFALPAAAIGALLTMLALVSPVHGVTPSPESDWRVELDRGVQTNINRHLVEDMPVLK